MTDRRRLAPGAEALDALVSCVRAQVLSAVAAGVDAVQIRERDLEAAALVRLAEEAVAASRGSRTRILVNDRVDVALAAGADGVHLRADSPPACRIRPLVPKSFVIGRSVHSLDDLLSAGEVDYVLAGTVWPTASKPTGHPLLGTSGLAALAAATAVPVLAIGGVNLARAAEAAAAGAAGIAAIGLFIDELGGRDTRDEEPAEGTCRAGALVGVVRALRHAFDNAGGDRTT